MASMYPAIKAGIGRWTYYIVKMKFGELSKEVSLSSEVHQDRTLDEAIQREINDSRARQDLVVYLHDREDRFLNSIVVAALGGSPTFVPLLLADAPENMPFRAMGIDRSFGVLTFEGGQRYYALDGQHRLAAIKTILEPKSNSSHRFARDHVTEDFRQIFREEEVPVIMVVQDPGDDTEAKDSVLRDYRRLFSSLNRYAKATEESTNIIMDEDDGIAILTRRLIREHEFFKWTVDNPSEYSIVKTTKGKNLKPGDPYFTQIEVLYAMNTTFLTSASRSARGWKVREAEYIPQKSFKKIWRIIRPDDDVLDDYYRELTSIWDGVLESMPELRRPPAVMRTHNPDPQDASANDDHLLFWPIGQELVAKVVRELLDERATTLAIDALPTDEVSKALAPLKEVDWCLRNPPWRGLLLVQATDRQGKTLWRMRNEGRSDATAVAREVLEFMLRITPLDETGEAELRQRWHSLLVPMREDDVARGEWEAVPETAMRVEEAIS